MKAPILIVFIAVLLSSGITNAQTTESTPPALSPADKDSVIMQLIKELPARYVFPDTAGKVVAFLRKQQKARAYEKLSDGPAFAAALTADLKKVSNDRHLRVRFSPTPIPITPERDLMTVPAEEKEAYGRFLRYSNYGIKSLEVLEGNIGYLNFEFFCSPECAGDTYAAAMNYIAHTDALIIDLRKCRGSMSPDALPFLCSYLFESPTHLNDIYWRKNDQLTQSWTYTYVSGKKYLKKPVYVLTDVATFSGAEELAYDLQHLKRATILGQPTGGGANPGGTIRLTNHFNAFVPIGRAINPITKTNWEGVGVKPDSTVAPQHALIKAKELALKYLIGETIDADRKAALMTLLQKTEAQKEETNSSK